MVCEYCGTIMQLEKTWGDGYEEPREYLYVCHFCGATCDDNQAYGIEWTEGEIKKAGDEE